MSVREGAEARRDNVNHLSEDGRGTRMAESSPRRRVRASWGLVANLHAPGPTTANPPASGSATVDLDSQDPVVADLMLLRPVTADSSYEGHIAVFTIVVIVVITSVVVVVATFIVAGPIDVPLPPKAHQLRVWSTVSIFIGRAKSTGFPLFIQVLTSINILSPPDKNKT